MRIYICAPEGSVSQDTAENLHSALTKFYGRFPQSDIEFFTSPDPKTTVYIMEKAPDSLTTPASSRASHKFSATPSTSSSTISA